jgi:hypothetical protein
MLMAIDHYQSQAEGEEITLSFLNHSTERYGVSLLAAVRKWIEFTTSRGLRPLWGRATDCACRTGIFVPSGMET